jgi:hypothetical protein
VKDERRIKLADTNEPLFHRSEKCLYSISKRIAMYEDEGFSESDRNGNHVDASDFEVEDCGQGALVGRSRVQHRSRRIEGEQSDFISASRGHGRGDACRLDIPQGSSWNFQHAHGELSNVVAQHQQMSPQQRTVFLDTSDNSTTRLSTKKDILESDDVAVATPRVRILDP